MCVGVGVFVTFSGVGTFLGLGLVKLNGLGSARVNAHQSQYNIACNYTHIVHTCPYAQYVHTLVHSKEHMFAHNITYTHIHIRTYAHYHHLCHKCVHM